MYSWRKLHCIFHKTSLSDKGQNKINDNDYYILVGRHDDQGQLLLQHTKPFFWLQVIKPAFFLCRTPLASFINNHCCLVVGRQKGNHFMSCPKHIYMSI